jgi:hypothetical protein
MNAPSGINKGTDKENFFLSPPAHDYGACHDIEEAIEAESR